MSNTEPRELIHAAMIGIVKDVGAIGKNQRNAAQGFNFRGIDDVYNELNHLFGKYGVYMTSEMLERVAEDKPRFKDGKEVGVTRVIEMKIRYWFHAEDGSKIATETWGEAMDTGDKATNKAEAIAHKYALLQAFLIPTADMVDPDAEVHIRERIEKAKKENAKPVKHDPVAQMSEGEMVRAAMKDANEAQVSVSIKTSSEHLITHCGSSLAASTEAQRIVKSIKADAKSFKDPDVEGRKKYVVALVDFMQTPYVSGEPAGEKAASPIGAIWQRMTDIASVIAVFHELRDRLEDAVGTEETERIYRDTLKKYGNKTASNGYRTAPEMIEARRAVESLYKEIIDAEAKMAPTLEDVPK